MVAVRCDSSELPPIMAQSLYVDLYNVGLDAAAAQIADVVNGTSTYRPPNQPFSNLVFAATGNDKELTIEVKAKHFLEPIGSFVVLIDNPADEFDLKPINEDPYKGGFNAGIKLDNGITTNGFLVTVFRGVTPPMPVRVLITAKGNSPLRVRGVLHQKSTDRWESVPEEPKPLPIYQWNSNAQISSISANWGNLITPLKQ